MLGPPQQAIRHTVEVHRQKCLHAAKETGGQTDASEGRSANGRLKTTQMHTVEISGQKITPCSHRNRQTRRRFGWTISQRMPEDHASTHHAVTETGSQGEALGGQSANGCQKTMQSYNTPMEVVPVLQKVRMDTGMQEAGKSMHPLNTKRKASSRIGSSENEGKRKQRQCKPCRLGTHQ